MDLTNFALLSALYDTKGANLYNEIYFPIIRYSLASQMNENKSSDGFSDIKSLQEVIKEKFDFTIPRSVLKGSVQRIDSIDQELTIYENGESFKIGTIWQDYDSPEIRCKSSNLENGMREIETLFQDYLKTERISCDSTFIDFFSNHTSDLLKYLNHENKGKSNDNEKPQTAENLENEKTDGDAELANLMRFIKILEKDRFELYEIAETFF